MVARLSALKCFLVAGVALGVLGASGCLIPFDHYAEGDVCGAGRDAGIRSSTAPDPVLRGCDAGPEPVAHDDPSSGAAGAAGTSGAEDSP